MITPIRLCRLGLARVATARLEGGGVTFGDLMRPQRGHCACAVSFRAQIGHAYSNIMSVCHSAVATRTRIGMMWLRSALAMAMGSKTRHAMVRAMERVVLKVLERIVLKVCVAAAVKLCKFER